MTDNGTFLVNGIERIIINQIVRSPGVYYRSEKDKNNVDVYCASLISNRGTWIKLEIDKDDFISIKIDTNVAPTTDTVATIFCSCCRQQIEGLVVSSRYTA